MIVDDESISVVYHGGLFSDPVQNDNTVDHTTTAL